MSDTAPRWTAMTRGDFDETAPLQLPVPAGPAVVPAEPDACGTQALFGTETDPRRLGRTDRRPAAPADQDGLF